MITLKMNTYTDDDKKMLYNCFCSMHGEMCCYCGTEGCENCKHAVVCDDIDRAIKYLGNIVNPGAENKDC